MTDEQLLLFLEKIFPEATDELHARVEHRKILLSTIEDLQHKVDCLASSDEIQTILAGILIVMKLMIQRERTA